MLEPIMLFAKPLLPCDLAHTHYDMRRGIRAQVTRVVNYAHFALNMSKSLSITCWLQYSASNHIWLCFPHTIDQNPILGWISHRHTVHSRLRHSLVKFLLNFTCITWKCYIFGLIGHVWPPKTIIKSISTPNRKHMHVANLKVKHLESCNNFNYAGITRPIWAIKQDVL